MNSKISISFRTTVAYQLETFDVWLFRLVVERLSCTVPQPHYHARLYRLGYLPKTYNNKLK